MDQIYPAEINGVKHTAMQRQKAVTAYFKSEQLLPFGLAGQSS